MFEDAGQPLPNNVRVACGLMSSGSRKSKTVGECWHSSASEDKGREIWIRPDVVDSIRVAGILIHECCHAALPDDVGHKKPFADLAKAMLLEGKPTATTEGEAFKDQWAALIEKIGEYPQPKFNVALRSGKKQTTRMIKFECVDGCGMIFRTSAKWAESVSQCPCCGGAL